MTTEKTYLFEIRCIVCGGLLATLVNGSDTYSMSKGAALKNIEMKPGFIGFVCQKCGEKNNVVIK